MELSLCNEDIVDETSDKIDVQCIDIQMVQDEWADPSGNQPHILPFINKTELKLVDYQLNKVEHFFSLLVTEDLFEEIANQTNLYAAQLLMYNESSRLKEWIPTSKNEIQSFFGLILWMGLVKLPEINLYWSKDPALTQTFPQRVMSRNRFELLLRMLHFTNNEYTNEDDSLCKIQPIVDTLNENFKKYYDPPEGLCVDESAVLLRGHVRFKHCIKEKNIRIFKLCSKQGYTHSFQIYCGKKAEMEPATPTNIVMSLTEHILGKGHTIYTDTWYTSLDLATKLINENTHLVGTIRSNRPGLCKEVVTKKLKRGEIFAKEHWTGITLLKWKDKQDVLALSTKHSNETIFIKKKGYECTRPKLIHEYINGKSSDVSNQMRAYYSPLRRNFKWYIKLVIELLLNIAVVNARIMYNRAIRTPISSLEYRKRLVMYLCNYKEEIIDTEDDDDDSTKKSVYTIKRHEIKKDQRKPAPRRRCTSCYKKNVKNFGTKVARAKTKRVTTYCEDCPKKPYLCIDCYNKTHRYMWW